MIFLAMLHELDVEKLAGMIALDITQRGNANEIRERPWGMDISRFIGDYDEEEIAGLVIQFGPDDINDHFIPEHEPEPRDAFEFEVRRAYRGLKTLVLEELMKMADPDCKCPVCGEPARKNGDLSYRCDTITCKVQGFKLTSLADLN